MSLREKLQAKQTTFGMWVTLESATVAEVAAALTLDWAVIEMEHGQLTWSDVADHVRVLSSSNTAAIVRVAEVRRETIQRALDIGAEAVILPMIGSADQLEQAFQYGRYPPRGVRGVGGERCVQWGLKFQEYLGDANQQTLIIPLLETRDAAEHIDEILDVDGLEAIFFGPADMSASYGHLGQWEGGDVANIIFDMQNRAANRDIASGVLARSDEEAAVRRDQGFRMIALGADVNLMIDAAKQRLKSVGQRCHP